MLTRSDQLRFGRYETIVKLIQKKYENNFETLTYISQNLGN